MTWLIGHLLAIGIGISLGLLGGGGSVLALPILVYVMGVTPKSAIAMTSIVVGVVSLLGLIPRSRRSKIKFKTVGIFGSATTLGAFLGARLATLSFVTETFQMLLFAVAMLLAAVFMIRRKPVTNTTTQNLLDNYPPPVCKYCWLWLLTEGIGVGILTGLVGVGGGFAIVPALVLLGNLSMPEAVATSQVIIALNSGAGLMGYVGHVSIDWQLSLSFTFAAGLGSVIGIYLSKFVPADQLQKWFGYFLIIVATFVLIQNRQAFERVKFQATNLQQSILKSN
jgi:uncharacterized protein